MKTATFKYTKDSSKSNSTIIYGTVTLKDNGKISVTDIFSTSLLSSSCKYQAKMYAHKIVELNFPSDMCENYKSTEDTDDLVYKLITSTKDFKINFLKSTEEYAKNFYKYIEKFINLSKEEMYSIYGIEYKIEYAQYGSIISEDKLDKNGKYNIVYRIENKYKKENDKLSRDFYNYKKIIKNGLNLFIESELKNAEEHYNNSIIKLASKLYNKGILKNEKIEVTSSKIKQNFECTIHHNFDGEKYTKQTRAWTIIAEGPIQRPHYRYLIK